MKKITQLLMVMLFFAMSSTIYAQTITGTVSDETGPLPGANIVEKGTTNGTTTDFDGKFTLKVSEGSGTVTVSFIGYSNKAVKFTIAAGETKDIGAIALASDNTLEEVVIRGVIDIAKDRQTPVAVSTIRAVEIQEKLGSQEFPEMLNSTPSVYATKQGGGFGDARINIRGFNQRNIAVMINGMPVNDMENGWVYWSNWAGLSDVTTAMQVQRGLGSSKLAISSVGGTINIVTNTSDKKEGGAVRASMGNDGYQKFVGSYSTGLLDSGLSASVLLSRTTGDGYNDGTEFEGHNYFIGLGYKINDNNNLMFTFTGAPQWHNQHSRATELDNYVNYGGTADEPNRKYNPQWGYLNGEVYTWRRNFYHKPVMSLNWDFNVSENSKVSTVFYGSWGRGGGSGPIGKINGGKDYYGQFRNADGQIKFDDIAKWNAGGNVPAFGDDRVAPFTNDNGHGFSRRASMNSHNWYGVVANFHNDASENFSWDVGVDARTYKGFHYRVMNDILGGSGYTDNRDKNNPDRNITNFEEVSPSFNPWVNIIDQQKIEYYNEGGVRWLGAFGQLEYKTDAVSTFLQFGVSNQAFKRTDYFNLAPDVQESDWESLNGFNVKGGLNWNINEHHNIFFNAGVYEKQPLFSPAVFPNYNNNDVNQDLTNEKILGVELGYGYKTENYRLNANIYRTSWKDKYDRVNSGFDTNGDGDTDTFGRANLSGIEQVHTGLELEGSMKFNKLRIEGMVSVGNWEYKKNVSALFYDDDNNPIIENGETQASSKTLYLEGKKVGDAAQVTARLGLNYEIVEGLRFDISQRYAGNLYAKIDATGFRNEDTESLKLPGYALLNAGISYKYKFKNDDKKSVKLRVNVNNLADHLYISESATNYFPGDKGNDKTFNGVNTRNRVYFGYGRTWNATLSFNF